MKNKLSAIACILPMIAILVSSCNKQEDNPLKLAISEKIKTKNVQIEKLEISNLTITDSVSLGSELDRRLILFRTKVKAENKMAEVCLSKKAPSKAQEHRKKAEQAEAIIQGLEQWRNSPDMNMDSTLYYIASFYASGECYDGAKLNPVPMKASFDAGYTVYNVQEAKGNVHIGMGTTIPGYKEFLSGFSLQEEEE